MAAAFRPRREPGKPVRTSAGAVFVARRRAPRAAARPLVLLHGWMMAHGYFASLVDALVGERELVLIDLPGFGESDCPAPSCFAYDFEAFACAVDEVLDRLALGPIDLLGHSLGGGVALRLARRPEIMRLILMAPLVYRIPLPLEAHALALPVLGRLLWQGAVRRRDFFRQMRRDVEDKELVGAEYVRWAYERFVRPGGRAASYEAFRVASELPLDSDAPARVRQPTLLVWGDADRLIPLSHGQRLRAAIPDARLEVVPATGHTPFIERPRLVAENLRRFSAEAA
jgi:pimeloyl-ACP methyl ester carboxylesterase